MSEMQDRGVRLQGFIREWVTDPAASGLNEAIDRTISGGYFIESDVLFAVRKLKDSILNEELMKWVQLNESGSGNRPASVFQSISTRKLLCLHAGNLPLVGLQDALAVLLSGAGYVGKISRKDPFLLPSVLDFIKQKSGDISIQYSMDVSDFRDMNFDEWMFAGSEASLKNLRDVLSERRIIHSGSRSLIRTAHFSVAVIDDWGKKIPADLIESIFRYFGKGCRSVAVVYSKFSLSEVKNDLLTAGRAWLNDNNYPDGLSELMKLKFSYNYAVGIDQVAVGNTLIQEGVVSVDHPQLVYWQPLKSSADIISDFGGDLQQIYYIRNGRDFDESGVGGDRLDTIDHAQSPPIWWKPDQIDVLNWILSR